MFSFILSMQIRYTEEKENMCDLIYREGILRIKPGKKDSAVDAILEDKELAVEFGGCDFDAIMEEIGFYVIDKKDSSAELKYHSYPEDTFYALDKVLSAIGSLTELKLSVVLRTYPLPCTLADGAVRQIIIRIRSTPAPVHGSLDPPDLRGTVFCIRTEYHQFTGILSHDSCRGGSDIQPGGSVAGRMLHRRFSFQNQLQVVVVFRTHGLPLDTAVLYTGFQSFPVIIRPDLRLDHLPAPIKPAVFEPHAGSIFLTFHAFEFIVFPEMNTFPVIKQILLHGPPYGRSDLLGYIRVNGFLVSVLLYGNICVQLIFTKSITYADICEFLIDAVLVSFR